jgi:hypothetical protein
VVNAERVPLRLCFVDQKIGLILRERDGQVRCELRHPSIQVAPLESVIMDLFALERLGEGKGGVLFGHLKQTSTADIVWQTLVEEVEERRYNIKRAPCSVVARRKNI